MVKLAKCGKNPWYCEFDPTDPRCCQSDAIQRRNELSELLKWCEQNIVNYGERQCVVRKVKEILNSNKS